MTCQKILFLYSLETFLPDLLNHSNRIKDESKIKTLGPYAYVLQHILSFAEDHRTSSPTSISLSTYTYLYRGLKLSPKQIKSYKNEIGFDITLKGNTSVLFDKDLAISYVLNN